MRLASILTLSLFFSFLQAKAAFELTVQEAPAEQVLVTPVGKDTSQIGVTIGLAFATAARLGLGPKGDVLLRWETGSAAVLIPIRVNGEPPSLPSGFSIEMLPEQTRVAASLTAGTVRDHTLYGNFLEAVRDAGHTIAGPLIERYPPGSQAGGRSDLMVAIKAPPGTND